MQEAIVIEKPDQDLETAPPLISVINDIEAMVTAVAKVIPYEPPVTHRFANGIYSREAVNHQGKVIVYDEKNGTRRLDAPCTFVSEPGTQRVVIALEHTVFTTFHANPTNERDLDKLEEMLIEEHSNPLLASELDEGRDAWLKEVIGIDTKEIEK